MMISEFSTFGSCESLNIFNKYLNEGFDEYYNIAYSVEFSTLISLMSKPVDYDEKLINSDNEYDNFCVNQDLSKDFLEFIKNNEKLEYVVIDTYNDVEYKIIELDDETYITETYRLRKMEYYNSVKSHPRLTIQKDFDKYFEVWKDACDRFFEFVNENCPNLKIILNMARSCYRYMDDDGKIKENESFKTKAKDNRLCDVLDYYIIENYDVELLKFNPDTLIDVNHIYGETPIHYEHGYYNEKTNQLNQIIKRNRLYGYNDKVNVKLREIECKELLFANQLDEFKNNK